MKERRCFDRCLARLFHAKTRQEAARRLAAAMRDRDRGFRSLVNARQWRNSSWVGWKQSSQPWVL
jgi:hypothetical protein